MSVRFQMFLGAVLVAALLLTVLRLGVDAIFAPAPLPHTAATPAPAPPPVATAPPEAPLPARLAGASAPRGQEVARKCAACHTFGEGEPGKVGPNLYGVVGAAKASKPGFAYSDALKAKGGTWTYEDLDRFLASPKAFVSGTKMTFAGLPDGQDRANVVAYLKSVSPEAPPLPAP